MYVEDRGHSSLGQAEQKSREVLLLTSQEKVENLVPVDEDDTAMLSKRHSESNGKLILMARLWQTADCLDKSSDKEGLS